MIGIVIVILNFVVDVVMLVEYIVDMYKLCCVWLWCDFGGGGINVVWIVY